MLGDRLSTAPAWVRWLVQSAIVAVYFVAFFVWVQPRFIHRVGWLWALTAIIAIAAVEAGILASARREIRLRYRALLDGLSNSQRLQALKALRTGKAPAEPEVLAAAIKTGELQCAYLRGQPRSQRLVIWAGPVYAIAAAIGMYVWSVPRYAAFFGLLAVGLGIRLIAYERRVRQTPSNLGRLRVAADRVLPDLPPDDGEIAVGFTKRRFRLLAVAVTVPMVIFLAWVLTVDRQRPDCGTAYAAFATIYDSRQLTEPQSVNWKSPDLSGYQDWSDRLQQFSRQVSNPAVASHLRRIAEQSVTAVSQVRAVASAPDDDANAAKQGYYSAIRHMVDEEFALEAYCS